MANLATAIAQLRSTALDYPGSREEHPWGQSAFKVGKKTFVFMTEFETALNCSFKLPQSFEFALDRPFAKPAGYGLARARWVDCHFEAGDEVPMDVIAAWIDESFRAVAPKKLVKQLPA
jgi:predicted DNA-binding protein (MmcQ/YjbR family)